MQMAGAWPLIALTFLALPLSILGAAYAGDGGLAIRVSDSTNGRFVSEGQTTDMFSSPPRPYTLEFLVQNSDINEAEIAFAVGQYNHTQWFFNGLTAFWADNDLRTTYFIQGAGNAWSGPTALGSDLPMPTLPLESTHVAIVVTPSGAETLVEFYQDGRRVQDSVLDAVYAPPLPVTLRIFETNVPATNMVIDELRIWNEARSATDIQEFAFRALPQEQIDSPTLEAYFSFDEPSTSRLTNLGRNELGFGDFLLSQDVVGSPMSKVEIATEGGFGLPTFTGLVVESDTDSTFEWTFSGGDTSVADDADLDLRFTIDAYPEEIALVSFSETANPWILKPVKEVLAPQTLWIDYYVTSQGSVSYLTRAYFELIPDSNASSILPYVVATAGFVIVLTAMTLVYMSKGRGQEPDPSIRMLVKDKGLAVEGGVRVRKRSKGSKGSKGSRGSKHRRPSKAKTAHEASVERAIDRLFQEMTLDELNLYVEKLIDEGSLEAATALALRLEEEAVGGELDPYIRIVQNLGDCLSMRGDEAGVSAVKTAKRTTMKMSGKVTKSHLDPGKLASAKKAAKKTYQKKRQDYDSAWDLETVKVSVEQARKKPRKPRNRAWDD